MDDRDRGPLSADRMAERLGDRLLDATMVPSAAFTLVDDTRDLVRAVVETDVDAATRAEVAAAIRAITQRLDTARRDTTVILARHPDGRIENLTQAGSGRLNPQAPPLTFIDLPPDPPRGAPPSSVEVHATCTFTAAHSGPPSGAHGGIVALLLDQVLGVATRAAGASGMTVSLQVDFRRPTPFGVPLTITARWTGSDGRKSTATGEIRADGVTTASASALFIRET